MRHYTLKLTDKEAKALIDAYAVGVDIDKESVTMTRKIIALESLVYKPKND